MKGIFRAANAWRNTQGAPFHYQMFNRFSKNGSQ